MHDYDVIIVGASISGCTAAMLYGRKGLKVCVIDHAEAASYKKNCSHLIQPSALPVMRRLGIDQAIEKAGGLRTHPVLWTPIGWVSTEPVSTEKLPLYAYNLRREKLDPLLREMARNTPGVELRHSTEPQKLVEENGRIVGVEVRSSTGETSTLRARLLVAADGRQSKLGHLSGAPVRTDDNHFFACWAYYRNLPLSSGTNTQSWIRDFDITVAFPTDDGVTLLVNFMKKSHLPEFHADKEKFFAQQFENRAFQLDLKKGERFTDGIKAMLDLPNISRRPVWRGMALIGDAAQASDPWWGVGCGWGFQSAEWLADATAGALTAGEQPAEIDQALERYRRQHRAHLRLHHYQICQWSTCRPTPMNRLVQFTLFNPANPQLMLHRRKFTGRIIGVGEFLSPSALVHTLWVRESVRRKMKARMMTPLREQGERR